MGAGASRGPPYPSDWENCGSATAEGSQTVGLDGCRPPSRVRPSDSGSVDNGGHVDSARGYYGGDHVLYGGAIVRTTVAAVSILVPALSVRTGIGSRPPDPRRRAAARLRKLGPARELRARVGA